MRFDVLDFFLYSTIGKALLKGVSFDSKSIEKLEWWFVCRRSSKIKRQKREVKIWIMQKRF